MRQDCSADRCQGVTDRCSYIRVLGRLLESDGLPREFGRLETAASRLAR